MTKEIKNILLGVVIGAIVLAGGQYAWSKYQANKGIKDLTVSMKAFQEATNKKAYFTSYFSSQPKTKNISVGLSNSSASEGGYCKELDDYMIAINDYAINYPKGADLQNWYLATQYYNQALSYWWESGCSLEMN